MKTYFDFDQFDKAEEIVNKLKITTTHEERCKLIDNISDTTILKLIILQLMTVE